MKTKLFLSLLAFTVLFSTYAHSQAQGGNIYALVVGVSKYSDPRNDLSFPNKDATQIYQLLKERTTPDKMMLITDQQATHDNILASAERLFSKAKPRDMVMIYFSGHGHDGGLLAHDRSVGFAELKKILRKVKGRKFIFADSCFSGAIRHDDPDVPNTQSVMGNQRVCLFLSSRSDQVSWESVDVGNGFFTFYLLAGLRGGADNNRDKIITARELFEFVNPRVKEMTKDVQVPVMWGRFEHNMEVLNWNR